MDKNTLYSEYDKIKGQLLGHKDIRLSFLGKEYEINEKDGKVTCTLSCKINLSDFEKKIMRFSDSLKKTITNGLLTTYTLQSSEAKVYTYMEDGEPVQVIANGKKKEFDYFDGFSVKASVKVQDGDVFDETTGKILSEAKAKWKAYRKAHYLFARLSNIFDDLADAFETYADDMYKYGDSEDSRYIDYAGLNDYGVLFDGDEEYEEDDE